MEVNLVTEGLKFMVLGMGTVFVFLIIMIMVMNLQAKILDKFFPDVPSESSNIGSSGSNKKNKVAAIIGAILQHNQAKQG